MKRVGDVSGRFSCCPETDGRSANKPLLSLCLVQLVFRTGTELTLGLLRSGLAADLEALGARCNGSTAPAGSGSSRASEMMNECLYMAEY